MSLLLESWWAPWWAVSHSLRGVGARVDVGLLGTLVGALVGGEVGVSGGIVVGSSLSGGFTATQCIVSSQAPLLLFVVAPWQDVGCVL